MRVVRDGDEGMILVYESEPAANGGPRTLVFESGNGRIRLPDFPQAWRTMDDRELLALFEH